MENLPTHESGVFLDFRHHEFRSPHAHAFRWVDVEHLRFSDASTDDRRLLEALIGHERFRDAYAGGGVDPEEIRHGEYRPVAITPEAYEPVDHGKARAVLREWADRYGPVPDTLEADLRREVFDPLDRADGVHHLTGVGENEYHDQASVHEFVLIDRAERRVALVVAADD